MSEAINIGGKYYLATIGKYSCAIYRDGGTMTMLWRYSGRGMQRVKYQRRNMIGWWRIWGNDADYERIGRKTRSHWMSIMKRSLKKNL